MRVAFLRFLIGITPVMLLVMPLFAQDKQSPPPSGMGGLGSLIPMLLLMFVIIYFLMIRPEQKKQRERQKMLGAIKKGDRVVTAGGIYGVVGNVKENSVMVKIAENTVAEFTKNSVSTVLNTDGSEKTVQKAPEKSGKEEKEKK